MAALNRIVIVGGPRTGKTTLAIELAGTMGATVRHTDDLLDRGWSEASAEAAVWLDDPGPYVLEGVAMARALRKWLARGGEGKPCDVVLVMRTHKVAPKRGHLTMARGVDRVLEEVRKELETRGVLFDER